MSPEPENGPNFRYRPSEAIEDLGGRPLARPYGAVDRPVRDGRRLGPGPVNAPLVTPAAREEIGEPREEPFGAGGCGAQTVSWKVPSNTTGIGSGAAAMIAVE